MDFSGLKQDHVTNIVREWLLAGKYCAGDTLPGNQKLADLFGVNPRTVAKGLAPLVKEGLIEPVPRRGTVVRKALLPIQTSAVGLVMNSSGEFYSDMISGLDELLAENDLFPIVISDELFQRTAAVASFLIRMVGKTRPYGYLILGDPNFPYSLLRENPNKFANSVFLLRYQAEEELPESRYVLIDYEDMGRQVVEYFARRNIRRILFPAVYEDTFVAPWSSMQLRIMHSIRKHAASAGLFFDELLFLKMFSTPLHKEALAEALKQVKEPTGVFAWFDSFFLYLNDILHELGKDLYRDFTVLGNFNTKSAEKYHYDSFDLRIDEICRLGVEMLTGRREDRKILLPAKLAEHSQRKIRLG